MVYLNDENLISDARLFFLGKMTEDERVIFETVFISDPEAFDLVRVSEDELVEEYVRGLLTREERQSFEAAYLSLAENKRKVTLTRSLIPKVATQTASSEKTSFWGAITAFIQQNSLAFGSAFTILLILGTIWLLLPKHPGFEIARDILPVDPSPTDSHPTPLPLDLNSQDLANHELAKQPQPSPRNDDRHVKLAPEMQQRTPVLALFSHTLRSGGIMPTLAVDNEVKDARLLLNLQSRDYDRYRAEIVDPDGNVVHRSGTVKANGKKVVFSFPANNIRSGEYSVRLSGITKGNLTESAADFSFRITHK